MQFPEGQEIWMALPDSATLTDRVRVAVALASAGDPLRFDLDRSVSTAKALIADVVESLPLVGKPQGTDIVDRLWARLSPLPPQPDLLNAALILLADHDRGVVAAVHAGREGVRQGVLPAALSAMASLGAKARHVTALLGPAVCGACYEVPEEMQADVARVAPAAAVPSRTGTAGLDLRAGIAELLTRAGVREVVHDPRCTVEDPYLFSHRRDGVTGRQAGLVWLD